MLKIQHMRLLILSFVGMTLSSCSCAIYDKSWVYTDGGPIRSSKFHDLARDIGFCKTGRVNGGEVITYSKRGNYLSCDNHILNLRSSFCPTLLTLIIGKSQIRRFKARYSADESDILRWFSQRGHWLKETSEGIDYSR